ncbi:hypothetical protein [Georgenia halophila]
MAIDQVPLREQAYSLGPAQYGQPVHQPDEALAVSAWIQTRTGHHLVEGVAVAWTPKAARIRYTDDHGREGYAWVWASAVVRR